MAAARVSLTLTGDLPAVIQVGDELDISGRITIHSITADLIDVSTMGERLYAPGSRDVDAYANSVTFKAVDGD